jgi:hypothetical protein
VSKTHAKSVVKEKVAERRGVSESFKARANEAAYWEAWVGSVLSRAGLYTLHHPFPANGGDYPLSWDLDVGVTGMEGDMHPVEVKAVSLSFHNAGDYPFEEALICSHNSWEKKWPGDSWTRRDFLFVSNKTGSILWLPTGTEVGTRKQLDKVRNETYLVKHTSKKNLKELYEFVEAVKERKAMSGPT